MHTRTLLAMTRPGFLAITAVACALGVATAAAGGAFSPARALLTLVLALAVHAGANALNDYHDARNGADAANTQGLFPFTGGSRLIQQGVTTPAQTRLLAWALLLAAVPGGIALAVQAGPGLLAIGAAGLLLAWAYSAPPLALMARGLGEPAVAAAWGLVVVGADYTQRGAFSPASATAAASFALLVANILLVNGFPDRDADARVGKRTLVVLLGPDGAAVLYAALALAAHLWPVAAMALRGAPAQALAGLLSAPLAAMAAAALWRRRRQPQSLRPAIVLTIAAASLHGLAAAAGYALLAIRS